MGKKIKIKTNKAASKRFKLRKRNPIKIFSIPSYSSVECGEKNDNVSNLEADSISNNNEGVSFIFIKRNRYTLTRTISGVRHSRRKRSSRSLNRDSSCFASLSDLKRKYPLYLKKK